MNKRRLRVLITCLEFRRKYAAAFGGLKDVFETFDRVIDATSLAVASQSGTPYLDYVRHTKVIQVNSLEVLRKQLDEMNQPDCLVWRPVDTDGFRNVISVVEASCSRWAVAENKAQIVHPLALINPRHWLTYAQFKKDSVKKRSDESPPRADFVFVNSHLNMTSLSATVTGKKVVRVRHMDGAMPTGLLPAKRVGLFVDQYLPFHDDLSSNEAGRVDPQNYYRHLNQYLAAASKFYDLEDIIISRHPNSLGEELSYLANFDCRMSQTRSLVDDASVVFGHYSGSLALAVQLRREAIIVTFPSVMPTILLANSLRLASALGLDEDSFVDGHLRHRSRAYVGRTLRQILYRRYFNSSAPTLSQAFQAAVTREKG